MLPQDKANHAVAGVILYALGKGFHSPELGLALAVIGALGKDVFWDLLLKKGNFELWDIVATVALPITLYAEDKF